MHDWYLANEILKTVLEYAQKNGFKKVSKIDIELGSISEHGEEITAENLIYNFKLLSKNTLADDANLNIKKTKDDNWKLVSIEE
ncbi:MAG: hypothetical protein A2V69_00810 [Candidatus Portnoybacteria bacterium RBG_13_40_8]|uniref:Uncharacterized protein n=1 Tax=Candidatus Portnoybacteria bacterium RBG_13_40_8 TaxID=1801990 RepID=A0A1G2F403_9BACT|nr:MAG: hypothetical protein A2V69_00810 [Candidatus Portnoybacteria bacterium RBG_13_40_8]OGZ34513.1 MAG: hypothetical protein A2V60_03020 [Candidatus Portnoybacteria bacterium RIFCSPHIGHO2_01_FULL_39_19]